MKAQPNRPTKAEPVQKQPPSSKPQQPLTINRKDDGYRGIWYMNQPVPDQYGFKYSGGLGTYCAKHKPFAVHCPQAQKTFFCYGGTTVDSYRRLIHMVSFFDHKTGRVPRPTILLDKQTDDAHDNPVIAIDAGGFVWIFSTAHGRARPAYIHRSVRPYRIDRFELVRPTRVEDGKRVPMSNFSYMQAWYVPGHGFLCFFTRYGYPAARTICFMSSPDGVRWSRWQRLAVIEHGHYQISAVGRARAGSAFNYHPRNGRRGSGANWRTNLYYIETPDLGRSWQAADGTPLNLPLKDVHNPALVHDYASEGLNVYLKDIRYDERDRPIILYLTSRGPLPGPEHGPRIWWTACWTGSRWEINRITTSDNNYDMGSLWLESDGTWRLIAPTAPAAQPYATGGEVVLWASRDRGQTWRKLKQLTRGSKRNHSYVRQPLNPHPDFYALWADGDSLRPSPSHLYFCTKEGRVFVLPEHMSSDWAAPEPVEGCGRPDATTVVAGRAVCSAVLTPHLPPSAFWPQRRRWPQERCLSATADRFGLVERLDSKAGKTTLSLLVRPACHHPACESAEQVAVDHQCRYRDRALAQMPEPRVDRIEPSQQRARRTGN